LPLEKPAATGEPRLLETLVHAIRPTIENPAAATLRRHSIRDPSAIDDAASIVLDGNRRLPQASSW
jgi:hypothetical protein